MDGPGHGTGEAPDVNGGVRGRRHLNGVPVRDAGRPGRVGGGHRLWRVAARQLSVARKELAWAPICDIPPSTSQLAPVT